MTKKTTRTIAAILAALLAAGAVTTTVAVPQMVVSAAESSAADGADAPVADGVVIDETNFPDENFRQFVKEQYDKDGDGVLSPEEIAAVQVMKILYDAEKGVTTGSFHAYDYIYKDDRDQYNGIQMDFTGLEHFTGLMYLGIKNIQADNLHLEQLPELYGVGFAAMPKTSFDFTSCCASLTDIGVINTPLEQLKVPAWTECIIAPNCQLKGELDVSACRGMVELYLNDNQLTDVKLPKGSYGAENWNLSNNQLTSLDLSGSCFESLDISGNPFTAINAETLKSDDGTLATGLRAHRLDKCTAFDVSHVRGLERVGAGPKFAESIKIGRYVRNLGLSNLDNLQVLDTTTLQAPEDNRLESLSLYSCNVKKLSTSQFKNLEELHATNSGLQHLNIVGNTKLLNLKVAEGNKQLKTIIANRQISSSCKTELNSAAKASGGKVTYVPDQVTGLKAIKKTKTTLKLRWNKVSGASGYKIYDAETGKLLANCSTQNGAKELRKTITNLKAGEKRKYKVRAYVTVDGTKHYGAYSTVYSKATAK